MCQIIAGAALVLVYCVVMLTFVTRLMGVVLERERLSEAQPGPVRVRGLGTALPSETRRPTTVLLPREPLLIDKARTA